MLRALLLLAAAVALVAAQPEFRTFDGTNVKPGNAQCGAANTALYREMAATSYEDGESTPWNGPPPRVISNTLFAGSSEDLRSLSDVHMVMGQFIAHEVVLSGPPHDASTESLPISVPTGDVWFDPEATGDKTIPFRRSETVPGGSGQPRRHLNRNTAWVDGSAIYGSSDTRAQGLRNATHPEYMAVDYTAFGALPPLNTGNMFYVENNAHRFPDEELRLTGDVRGNENPVLTALHTVFLREHNRWVDVLRDANPSWDSERLFQEARRRVIAIEQSIIFNEYIPATVGNPLPLYDVADYDPNSPCGTGDFYATAAFRYGHSETNSMIPRFDADGKMLTSTVLRDAFFNPTELTRFPIETLFRGAARQRQQQVDTFVVDDLRNFLFGQPGGLGLDLTSVNIMRSRDHGIAFYNDAREHYGLPRKTSFDDITVNQRVVGLLRELYNNDIDRVDSYVGGLAEDPIPRDSLGELFTAAVVDEYSRKRNGDRLYYGHPDAGFTADEIAEWDRTTLSDLVLRNTDIGTWVCSAMFSSADFDCGAGSGSPSPNGVPVVSSNGTSFLGGDINLDWSIAEDVITFTLVGQTDGWVGMALASSSGNMIGADAWVGWVEDDGSVSFNDYEITAREAGCPGVCPDTSQGGSNDVFDVSGFEVDGVTTIIFSRRFDTGDALDEVITEGETSSVLFALGGSDGLSYHGGSKVAADINFFTGETNVVGFVTNSAEDRLTVHGVMMFMCWAVVFPLGIFIARFLKEIPIFLAWWFQMHLIVQYLGVIFLMTGFALALEATAALDHDHFDNTHAKLGMATFVLGIFVPAFGQFTAIFWSAGSKKGWFTFFGVRLFPDAVHYVTGYLSPIVAFVTLFYGLHEHDADWWWFLLMALWIAFICIAFFVLLVVQIIKSFLVSDDGLEEDDDDAAASADDGNWSD